MNTECSWIYSTALWVTLADSKLLHASESQKRENSMFPTEENNKCLK